MHLHKDARKWRDLWSVQASIALGLLNGAVLGLAAFQDIINPWVFLGLNVFGYGLITLLRIIKQPGLENDPD